MHRYLIVKGMKDKKNTISLVEEFKFSFPNSFKGISYLDISLALKKNELYT